MTQQTSASVELAVPAIWFSETPLLRALFPQDTPLAIEETWRNPVEVHATRSFKAPGRPATPPVPVVIDLPPSHECTATFPLRNGSRDLATVRAVAIGHGFALEQDWPDEIRAMAGRAFLHASASPELGELSIALHLDLEASARPRVRGFAKDLPLPPEVFELESLAGPVIRAKDHRSSRGIARHTSVIFRTAAGKQPVIEQWLTEHSYARDPTVTDHWNRSGQPATVDLREVEIHVHVREE